MKVARAMRTLNDEAPKRTRPLSKRDQQLIRIATARAYFRFCDECSAYPHNLANYLTIMGWIDERRIEMLAEGRRHWVPTHEDFWQAVRDCWDDLDIPNQHSTLQHSEHSLRINSVTLS